ncbi:hypothetical protein BC936DRAFT_141630 [Jimgerdemannia flammicorona]|uniref:Uncharacterized protein n=1 Tax=Jimgerdemannia flammicorona TaxID=994334 RepID=A0A433A1X3_9FUNG|nr:hypothetical protein BC936DRAFT_141630 [Jimgerdemannia flammicorona]
MAFVFLGMVVPDVISRPVLQVVAVYALNTVQILERETSDERALHFSRFASPEDRTQVNSRTAWLITIVPMLAIDVAVLLRRDCRHAPPPSAGATQGPTRGRAKVCRADGRVVRPRGVSALLGPCCVLVGHRRDEPVVARDYVSAGHQSGLLRAAEQADSGLVCRQVRGLAQGTEATRAVL